MVVSGVRCHNTVTHSRLWSEHPSGHRVANRGHLSRARYVSVLGPQEEFKEEMRAALEVENASGAMRVVWLADGAPGNWLMASLPCPRAIQVPDY